MKLLYMGDVHERQNPPLRRIDDWQDTLDKKAEEILAIANKYKVKAILQGGDFYDAAKVTDEYQAKVIERWSSGNVYGIMKKFLQGDISNTEIIKELKKGKPIIGIAGNHDEFGGSMQAFGKTSLSFLQTVGFINLVTKEHPIILKDDKEGFNVAITGCNYNLKTDKDANKEPYMVDKKEGDFHIHLIHGMLTEKSYGTLFPHTLVDEIRDTKADLTIAGHDHIGFDTIEHDGKLFVNPGAVIRLNNGEREMARQPKVMLIDITKEKGIQLKMIPLKSAKPAEEVLSVENKIEKKTMEQRINSINKHLDEVSTSKTRSVLDIIDEMSTNDTITEDIKKTVKDDLINEMTKDVTRPLTDPTPYIIERLEIKNFQSHADSTLDFDKHMNVIIGESDDGKSAIIRAFEFVFGELTGSAKDYIRKGEKYASVTIYLDNGYIIERKVEKKSNGFNGYNIYDPNKNEWETSNSKNTPYVQELLGYSRVVLDDKNSFSVNFLDQDDNHFFIDKSTTASLRAKIIGTVYKTHFADSLLRKYETEIKRAKTLLQAKKEDVDERKTQLDCMCHVEPLKEFRDDVKKRYEIVSAESAEVDFLNQKLDEMIRIMGRIKTIDAYCERAEQIVASRCRVEELEREAEHFMHIKSVTEKLDTTLRHGKVIRAYIEQGQKLIDKRGIIDDIIEDFEKKERLIHYYEKYLSLNKKIKANELYIKQAEDLVPFHKQIDFMMQRIVEEMKFVERVDKFSLTLKNGIMLRKMIDKAQAELEKAKESYKKCLAAAEERQRLTPLVIELARNAKDIQIKDKEIIKLTKEKEEGMKKYKDFLSEIKVCPTCKQEMDDTVISGMLKDFA